jgi:hypothetical protein
MYFGTQKGIFLITKTVWTKFYCSMLVLYSCALLLQIYCVKITFRVVGARCEILQPLQQQKRADRVDESAE